MDDLKELINSIKHLPAEIQGDIIKNWNNEEEKTKREVEKTKQLELQARRASVEERKAPLVNELIEQIRKEHKRIGVMHPVKLEDLLQENDNIECLHRVLTYYKNKQSFNLYSSTCEELIYQAEKEYIDITKLFKKIYECVICYNKTIEPIFLNCGHDFCKKCIDKWLERHNTCPICRKYIVSALDWLEIQSELSSSSDSD